MVEHARDLCAEPSTAQPTYSIEDEAVLVEPLSIDEIEKWRLAFRVGEPRKSFYDRKRAHYRECRRRDLDIPVDLEVISPDGMVMCA